MDYKQPAGTIFTDWKSAGLRLIDDDLSVRFLPLIGKNVDTELVLSNINNVRNNLLKYGDQYLDNTKMLNNGFFSNPYRNKNIYEINHGPNSDFTSKKDGDIYAKQQHKLRVDLPSNYNNVSTSSWTYINPAYIIPNTEHSEFLKRFKYGTFDLDSIKLTGESCLTSKFNILS